ncbi:MAG: DUF4178 domain-containing protein [Burkholderiaceae bacterium]
MRDGEDAPHRIGVSAELFDDHSPLQLGARGKHQGVPFTLVGRLQYSYADGTWNEWHVLFDASPADGTPRSAWLSEDNGAYVLAFDLPAPADPPPADELHAGERRLVAGAVERRLGHPRAPAGGRRRAAEANCSWRATSWSPTCAARRARSARWTTATPRSPAGRWAARWGSPSWR